MLRKGITLICISRNNYKQIKDTFLSINNSILENKKLIQILHIDKSNIPKSSYNIGKNLLNDYSYEFIIQKSNGIFNAFNEGLKLVKTEYVFFLNTGDKLWKKNSLQIILNEVTKNRKKDIIYFDCVKLKDKKFITKKSSRNIFKCLIPFSIEFPCHQSCIFRTEIHRGIIYPNNIGGDEFVIRHFLSRSILKSTSQYCSEPICLYDLSGISSAHKISYMEFFNRSLGYIKLMLFHRIISDLLKIYPFYFLRKRLLIILRR